MIFKRVDVVECLHGMSDQSSNNKQIAKNTLLLYFRMALTMTVSLYTSRVVLNVLGLEDYGIYTIVAGFIILFSFINGALASATQRFLNFELGRNECKKIEHIFSMSINIYFCLIIVVILLAETIGLWFLNTQINIPVERMNAANCVYQFSVLSLCISFIQVPYHASVIACEKMSFFAYIAIIEVALKLVVVLLLVYIGFDKLKLYSILLFGVTMLIFMCYKLYCSATIFFCHYKFFWDKSIFSELLSFSGWMLLGAAAGVGTTQGTNILLNIFYGVTVNAAVGVSNQVNAAVNQFVTNFQTAFMPQIIKLYAVGDISQLQRLINRSSRFSFLLLFALACPLMLNIDIVLNLWLKNVPEHSSAFCILILIYSLIEAMSKPVGLAIHATGQVKKYNIVMSIALSMNILFSFVFLKLGLFPEIIAIISILVCILCLIIRLYLAQRHCIVSIIEYFQNVMIRVITVVLVTIPVPLFFSKYYAGLTAFFISSLTFVLIFIFAVYFIGFTYSERIKVCVLVKKNIKIICQKITI